jgi:hypothetical protein
MSKLQLHNGSFIKKNPSWEAPERDAVAVVLLWQLNAASNPKALQSPQG